MSAHRQVWETLANLLQRAEKSVSALSPAPQSEDLAGLSQEVRRLGKAQYKANALTEEQAGRLEKALAIVQSAQEQNARLLETLADERAASARKELLDAFLPALDGLENAIASGQRYLAIRDRAAHKKDLSPDQAILVSPADRAMLAGWLDGLRLVSERLLAILEAGGVMPILTIGQPFDPYKHVAVGAASETKPGLQALPGHIIAEERRGYQSSAGVLRYAEVVVYRPK